MGDKVIMIRKYSPSFKAPAEVARDSEKTALQNLQTLRSAKMVSLTISARCDKVGAALRKSVGGGMRPGSCWLGHRMRVIR